MALQIIDHGSDLYQKMVKLRSDILRKPLGLSFSEEELAKEKDNILVVAQEGGNLLGCCMLVEQNAALVQLRQMAVNNNLQGKGIGKALLIFSENIARDSGYATMMMHARDNAVGFYQKLGYNKSSEMFLELSIPHFVLEKKL